MALEELMSDADLKNAYVAGCGYNVSHVDEAAHVRGLRAAGAAAIAAHTNAQQANPALADIVNAIDRLRNTIRALGCGELVPVTDAQLQPTTPTGTP